MCRFQFSLRTVFIVTAACCLLLGWWVPSGDKVQFAQIYFHRWGPDLAALRITTAEEFWRLVRIDLRGDPSYPADYWPNLSKSDVIFVPLNGLAGEPMAEYRIEALGKPVRMDFHNKPLRAVVDALSGDCLNDGRGSDLLQINRKEFWEDGVAQEMPITFHCEGVPLREVLHSMLEPHGLTIEVWEGEVLITPLHRAQAQMRPFLWSLPLVTRFTISCRGTA